MKYLLWGLILAAVVVWVLRAKKSLTNKHSGPAPARDGDVSRSEPMVQCARCGVHLPRSEAVPGSGDRVYCGDEHRRLDGGA